jgi:hypothetical protein
MMLTETAVGLAFALVLVGGVLLTVIRAYGRREPVTEPASPFLCSVRQARTSCMQRGYELGVLCDDPADCATRGCAHLRNT